MWSTLIPTAIAAAIVGSVVHLASEINNVRVGQQGTGIESTFQRDASVLNQMQRSFGRGAQLKKNLEPGA